MLLCPCVRWWTVSKCSRKHYSCEQNSHTDKSVQIDNTEAQFIVHNWVDKIDYGIGLTYRPVRVHGWRAGTTTLCHSRFYPPVMDYEFCYRLAYAESQPFLRRTLKYWARTDNINFSFQFLSIWLRDRLVRSKINATWNLMLGHLYDPPFFSVSLWVEQRLGSLQCVLHGEERHRERQERGRGQTENWRGESNAVIRFRTKYFIYIFDKFLNFKFII